MSRSCQRRHMRCPAFWTDAVIRCFPPSVAREVLRQQAASLASSLAGQLDRWPIHASFDNIDVEQPKQFILAGHRARLVEEVELGVLRPAALLLAAAVVLDLRLAIRSTPLIRCA